MASEYDFTEIPSPGVFNAADESEPTEDPLTCDVNTTSIEEHLSELPIDSAQPNINQTENDNDCFNTSSVYDYTEESDGEVAPSKLSSPKGFGSARKRTPSFHKDDTKDFNLKETKKELFISVTPIDMASLNANSLPKDTPPVKIRKKPGPKPGFKRKKKENPDSSVNTTQDGVASTSDETTPKKPGKKRKIKAEGESSEGKPPKEKKPKAEKPPKPDKIPIPYIELAPSGLPEGWSKKALERKAGATAGKRDIYIFSPEGKRFRSKKEIHSYCEEHSIDPGFIDKALHSRLPGSRSNSVSGTDSPVPKEKSDELQKKKYKKKKKVLDASRELPERLRRTGTKRKLSSAVLEALQDSDDFSETEYLKKMKGEEGGGGGSRRGRPKAVSSEYQSYPKLNKLKYTSQVRPYSRSIVPQPSKIFYSRYGSKNTARKSTGLPLTYQMDSTSDVANKSFDMDNEESKTTNENEKAIPKVIIKRLMDKGNSKEDKKNHVIIIKNSTPSSPPIDKDMYSFEDIEIDESKCDPKTTSNLGQSDNVIYAVPSHFEDQPERDIELDDILNKPLKMGSQEFIDWLFAMGFLYTTQYCTKHKDYYTGNFNVLKLQSSPEIEELAPSGGYTWISACCFTRLSVFNGSFFATSKNPKLVLALMNKWASMSKKRYKLKSLDFITKMNNYFRSICTISIQEIASNFGIDHSVVEMGAVMFEKIVNQLNIQVEVLGIYDRETGYYRFFAYQYATREEKNLALARINYQKLIHRQNATIICDASIDEECIRKTFNNVMVCGYGEKGIDSNENISNYLRTSVAKLMKEVVDLMLTIEEIQLLLNELSWREIYGTNRIDAYTNLFQQIRDLMDEEVLTYEMVNLLDWVIQNPDGSWTLQSTPKSVLQTQYPEIYQTEIKIDFNIIRRGITPKDNNSEVLKKFRALAKASSVHICEQGYLKLNLQDNSLLCMECGARMGTQKHYSSLYKCSLCSFTSSCSNRLSYHYFSHSRNCIENAPSIIFKRRRNPYIPLLEPYFCKCGFIPETGNEMANHILKCEESEGCAYASMESALSGCETDFDSSEEEEMEMEDLLKESSLLQEDELINKLHTDQSMEFNTGFDNDYLMKELLQEPNLNFGEEETTQQDYSSSQNNENYAAFEKNAEEISVPDNTVNINEQINNTASISNPINFTDSIINAINNTDSISNPINNTDTFNTIDNTAQLEDPSTSTTDMNTQVESKVVENTETVEQNTDPLDPAEQENEEDTADTVNSEHTKYVDTVDRLKRFHNFTQGHENISDFEDCDSNHSIYKINEIDIDPFVINLMSVQYN